LVCIKFVNKEMKKLHLILFIVILWSSCKEPGCTDLLATNYNVEANKDDGSCEYVFPVKINVLLTENGRALSRYGTYNNNSVTYRLETLKYYLSHLQLNNNEVADVFLYDVESDNNFILTHHNSNKINAIEFGLGLTESQNNSDPTTFVSTHPLSFAQNTYWYMTPPSYMFVMAEQKADTLGNGVYSLPVTYHLAHNDLYRLIQKNVDINLSLTDTVEVDISLELVDFMNNIDYNEVVPHISESTPIANLLMDNLANAFSIQ